MGCLIGSSDEPLRFRLRVPVPSTVHLSRKCTDGAGLSVGGRWFIDRSPQLAKKTAGHAERLVGMHSHIYCFRVQSYIEQHGLTTYLEIAR